MMTCADCGSEHFYEWKKIILRGQPWLVRKDDYRFYIKPTDSNPLLDREERSMLSFKHDDGPAEELAEFLYNLIIGV